MRVARFGQQVDRTRLAFLRFAEQQAAAVGLALADFADLLVLLPVFVSVEAADDAPAVAVVDAALGLDADGLPGKRLAVGIEYRDLDAVLAAAGRPVGDLDAHGERRRPQFDAAAQRLDFAVRVGEAHFRIDLARAFRLGRQHDIELAGAGFVERDGLTVEDQGFFLAIGLDVEGSEGGGVEIDVEVVGFVPLVDRPARTQRGRDLGRRVLRRPAVQEGQRQRERYLVRRHLARRDALHAASEHRQPEVGDAEFAAVVFPSLAAAEHDFVGAELGRRRDLPVVGRAGEFVPGDWLGIFRAALGVAKDQFGWQQTGVGEGEALAVAAARQVLHRQRLAGAEQAAVEDAMDLQVAAVAPGFDAETPGLDTFVPVRTHETEVAVQAGAGKQEVAALAIRHPQCLVDEGAALAVGLALPQRLAVAAGDADLGAGHRLAAVERGDPDQRIVAARLQVHREVGDQCGGAHVHRPGRGEQGVAEQLALDLDDVVARLRERDADHLEFGAAPGLGQILADDAGAALEEGQFARVVGVDAVQHLAVDLDLHLARLLLELLQRVHRGDHVGVLGQALAAEAVAARQAEAGGFQRRLDVAQRDRQQSALLQFDDAEIAGELGQRRQAAGARLQRKTGRVGQRPAGFVLESGRDLDGEFGVLRQGAGEPHRAEGGFLVAVVPVRVNRLARAVRRAQDEPVDECSVERRVEFERQPGQRRARGAGLFAFAGEAGLERLAHCVDETFFLLGGRAVRRLDALAPHQPGAAAGRQPLAAGDNERRAAHAADLVEHLAPDVVRDRARRETLADPVGFAPEILFERLRVERTAAVDDKGLVLLDGLTGRRDDAPRTRGGALEFEAALAAERFAGGRRVARFRREDAALSRLQGAAQLPRPGARVDPAALAGDVLAIELEGSRRRRVAELDHLGAEARGDARLVGDLALRLELLDGGGAGLPGE